MKRASLCGALSLAVAAGGTAILPAVSTSAAGNAIALTELNASPLVASLSGFDLGFATNSNFSSPAVADVTGDGQPEIVIGGLNSIARAYDLAGGRVLTMDPGGADLSTGHGATQASPAIGDVNGDGVSDVVIANTGGMLAAYSLRGGVVSEIYRRYVAPEFNGAIVGLFGTPALGYLDIDRSLDVVTSSWGQTLEAFSGPSATPMPAMRQWLRDTIWSSPVIGDIGGDGRPSIVVGGDCDGSGTPQPCYGIGKGGYVWAFNLDGSLKWRYFVRDAVVWSTPALADLNRDGALDVVVGTGLYFLGPEANKIMALNGKTGELMWEAPTGGPVLGSPAVAELNGQKHVWVMSGGGMLMSWNALGQLQWQQCVTDGACSSGAGTFGGVSIADINNDGALEAIVQAEQQLRVLDAQSGTQRAIVRSKYPNTLFASYSTPTIASVNGQTWIVQLNVGDQNRNLRTDGGDDLVVSVWTTGTPLGKAPWPTFKANMARTGGPQPVKPASLGPSERRCLSVAGSPGDAAIVNLTPVAAQGPGNGQLISSNISTPPEASNVNFNTNTVDPNVAIATIGPDGNVCYANSNHNWTHLVADHLGTIKSTAYTPAAPNGAPQRKIDTRIGQGGTIIPPSGRVCFSVAGSPGDAAIVNLTPVEAQGPGNGQLISANISTPPEASNVNFNTNTVDPNVAIATIGPDGNVCYANSSHSWVHLVADHLGTIKSTAYTPAAPNGAPVRKADTRIGVGGGLVPPSGRVCFAVAGAPGDAAVVNLTPVEAQGAGNGLLVSSNIATPPEASNVNFNTNTVDPNVAIATIGPDGNVCYANSSHSWVHLVADHLGTIKSTAYTPAAPNGAPVRKADTRS